MHVIRSCRNLMDRRFKALETLRKAKEWDVPFILVSGKIGEETAVKAMKLGANDCVMKDNLNRHLCTPRLSPCYIKWQAQGFDSGR